MTPEEAVAANTALLGKSPSEIIEWTFGRFPKYPIIGSSFGPNSAVLLHLVLTRYPETKVVWVDPGDVPEANKHYAEALSDHFGFELHKYLPETELSPREAQILKHGSDEERFRVYEPRKRIPMERAIATLKAPAIFYGIRDDQDRQGAPFAPLMMSRGYVRVYPLLKMTREEARRYLSRHGLPSHEEDIPESRTFVCPIHK